MKIHVYHHFCDEENKKLDQILKGQEEIKKLILQSVADPEIIKKLAADLDTSTNKLKEAVDKNTPAGG